MSEFEEYVGGSAIKAGVETDAAGRIYAEDFVSETPSGSIWLLIRPVLPLSIRS